MGFLGKSTGEGCRFLLQEIFQIQGLNLHLLHLLNRQSGSLPLNHLGRPMQNLLIYKVGCFNSTNFLGLGRIKCKNICRCLVVPLICFVNFLSEEICEVKSLSLLINSVSIFTHFCKIHSKRYQHSHFSYCPSGYAESSLWCQTWILGLFNSANFLCCGDSQLHLWSLIFITLHGQVDFTETHYPRLFQL